MEKSRINEIEKRIGYVYHNKNILKEAFTHSSYANEFPQNASNERLEFLGDAVLNFVIAEQIYSDTDKKNILDTTAEMTAGEMTKLMGERVSKSPLATAIRNMDVYKFMRLGKGASNDVNNLNEKTISNLFEAIVASIYLDSGENLQEVKKFIKKHLPTPSIVDYKSTLGEYCQKHKIELEYKIENESSPFVASVYLDGSLFGQGEGQKKKDAEKNAAKFALIKIKKDNKK